MHLWENETTTSPFSFIHPTIDLKSYMKSISKSLDIVLSAALEGKVFNSIFRSIIPNQCWASGGACTCRKSDQLVRSPRLLRHVAMPSARSNRSPATSPCSWNRFLRDRGGSGGSSLQWSIREARVGRIPAGNYRSCGKEIKCKLKAFIRFNLLVPVSVGNLLTELLHRKHHRFYDFFVIRLEDKRKVGRSNVGTCWVG